MKSAVPARRIEIVKYVGTMLFDLRFQDIAQRCARLQALLARPDPLNVVVIAVGEKCPFGPLIDRQKNMRRRLPEIQERVDLAGKRGTVLGQFANLRTQRGIISGILEQPHKPGIPTMIRRVARTEPANFTEGQAELHARACCCVNFIISGSSHPVVRASLALASGLATSATTTAARARIRTTNAVSPVPGTSDRIDSSQCPARQRHDDHQRRQERRHAANGRCSVCRMMISPSSPN